MSPFQPEDEDLTQFLRHHRSQPPVASPDLEDRIVRSLPKRSRFSRPLVLFASGIAACTIGVIMAQPARSPAPDANTLEAFMENSWSTTIDGTPTSGATSDYLALMESTTNN
ncbi:MAG TPA: hypothetical protein VL134_04895 [Leptolyngbya sp.]|jgi:hypothetical protein|nr:hypothetical protein [Leptolyngbya sp.]